jgi:hypothetical protein
MQDTLSKRKLLTILLAVALLLSFFPLTALAAHAVTEEMQSAAQKLNAIGLFKGTDKGFELEKAPDRVTAFVMLIRLTGKEAKCLNGNWTHPFSDVPAWADRYIGYAYENGLTTGVGGGRFGASDRCTTQMYAVMALRALGYSDSGSSPVFTYATAIKAAVNKGIISQEQLDACKDDFLRGDLALISSNLMTQTLNGTETRLIDSLVASGAVRQSDADAAKFGQAIANSGGQFGLKIPSGLAAPNVHDQIINVADGGCQILGTMSVSDFKNYCSQVQAAGFVPPEGTSGIQETDYLLEYFGTRGNDLVHFRLDRATSASTTGDVVMTFGIG